MIIGVPKEIKAEEYRIAVVPAGIGQLVSRGHGLLVQKDAGLAAGYSNEDYTSAGAEVVAEAENVFASSDLIVKVKEPIEQEYAMFKEKTAVFCYLHSETRPTLINLLLQKHITAIAYENIKSVDGAFPLLAPMSIIAGQQAILQGMQFLWSHRGGIGVSMVAYPGLEPPEVVVLGAGQAGFHAAKTAASLGANVALFEIDPLRIQEIASQLPANVRILDIQAAPLEPYVCRAHLLINTATIPPNSTKHLVDRAMIGKMRKGSVIVDVTANLKGAIGTIDHYTTHADPVWNVDGVIHYAVTNIPGTVARTASQALSAAVLPYLLELADKGAESALRGNPALARGLTSIAGLLTWREAGLLQNKPWLPPQDVLTKLAENGKAL